MLFQDSVSTFFLSYLNVVRLKDEKSLEAVCPDAPNAELDLFLENVKARLCWRRHVIGVLIFRGQIVTLRGSEHLDAGLLVLVWMSIRTLAFVVADNYTGEKHSHLFI